jgi:hypothetical protein
MDVSAQFNKFAGKEVAVTETPYKLELKNLGMTYEGVNADYDDKDPVISSLKEEASKAGFSLRIWMPESVGTMDWRTDRLNVYIAKEPDSKYRIQPNIHIG